MAWAASANLGERMTSDPAKTCLAEAWQSWCEELVEADDTMPVTRLPSAKVV